MKAIHIVKEGAVETAFEVRELPTPSPAEGEVGIQVEAFGLNFADVMARRGLYRDRPPLPAVVGYEVVGTVDQTGTGVDPSWKGKRVVGFTRFGGYADYAITKALAIAEVGPEMDAGVASAIATQYCTAWYAAEIMGALSEGETVLIQAAAGGVGTALVQIAKLRNCTIFGTAGSAKKLEYLREQGVQHPINYRETDFAEVVAAEAGPKSLDMAFDSVGGVGVKKAKKLLASGGRLVLYGAASMSDARNIFSKIRIGLGFGIYHPIAFLMSSQSLIGVNMLRIADDRPQILSRCMREVTERVKSGALKPVVGGRFKASEIAEAQHFLESRASIGKIVVSW